LGPFPLTEGTDAGGAPCGVVGVAVHGQHGPVPFNGTVLAIPPLRGAWLSLKCFVNRSGMSHAAEDKDLQSRRMLSKTVAR
jgi:hypothetical protein